MVDIPKDLTVIGQRPDGSFITKDDSGKIEITSESNTGTTLSDVPVDDFSMPKAKPAHHAPAHKTPVVPSSKGHGTGPAELPDPVFYAAQPASAKGSVINPDDDPLAGLTDKADLHADPDKPKRSVRNAESTVKTQDPAPKVEHALFADEPAAIVESVTTPKASAPVKAATSAPQSLDALLDSAVAAIKGQQAPSSDPTLQAVDGALTGKPKAQSAPEDEKNKPAATHPVSFKAMTTAEKQEAAAWRTEIGGTLNDMQKIADERWGAASTAPKLAFDGIANAVNETMGDLHTPKELEALHRMLADINVQYVIGKGDIHKDQGRIIADVTDAKQKATREPSEQGLSSWVSAATDLADAKAEFMKPSADAGTQATSIGALAQGPGEHTRSAAVREALDAFAPIAKDGVFGGMEADNSAKSASVPTKQSSQTLHGGPGNTR